MILLKYGELPKIPMVHHSFLLLLIEHISIGQEAHLICMPGCTWTSSVIEIGRRELVACELQGLQHLFSGWSVKVQRRDRHAEDEFSSNCK